jgi:hypothetical protein
MRPPQFDEEDLPSTIEALSKVLHKKSREELFDMLDDINEDPQGFKAHVGEENAERFLNTLKQHIHGIGVKLNRQQRRALESTRRRLV